MGGLKKSPEYKYEYYSVCKNHPNTNIIRFENIDRIRIRIFWYSNIIRIIFEYRIIRSPLVYAKLESNSEPERASVCKRMAVRAGESQSGSHREPERASESLREASLTFLAYLNIVLLQNN